MPKSDTVSMQVLSSLGVNSIPGFRHRESLSDPQVVSPVGPGLRLPGAGPFPLRQFPGLRSRGAIVFPLAQNRSFQGS